MKVVVAIACLIFICTSVSSSLMKIKNAGGLCLDTVDDGHIFEKIPTICDCDDTERSQVFMIANGTDPTKQSYTSLLWSKKCLTLLSTQKELKIIFKNCNYNQGRIGEYWVYTKNGTIQIQVDGKRVCLQAARGITRCSDGDLFATYCDDSKPPSQQFTFIGVKM